MQTFWNAEIMVHGFRICCVGIWGQGLLERSNEWYSKVDQWSKAALEPSVTCASAICESAVLQY